MLCSNALNVCNVVKNMLEVEDHGHVISIAANIEVLPALPVCVACFRSNMLTLSF